MALHFAENRRKPTLNFTEGSRQTILNFAEAQLCPQRAISGACLSRSKLGLTMAMMTGQPMPCTIGEFRVAIMNGKRMFACPVCIDPREVKITKKNKPYITCDPCGIQVFVRGPAGIEAFNRMVERGGKKDLWSEIETMQKRYRLRCPECGYHFWIEPGLAKASPFDGSLQGFRCPAKDCREVVPWKTKV